MYVDLAEDLSRAAVPVWAPCDEGWPGQDNREHGQVSGNRAAVHVKKNTEGWPRQDHREHGQLSGNRAAVYVRPPYDEGWPGEDHREHGQVSGNRAAVHKRSPCDEDRKKLCREAE